MAPLINLAGILNALGNIAINDAHDSSPQIRLGYYYLQRIGCGAEDATDLLDAFDGVQNVNGKRAFHQHHEGMAAGEGERVVLGGFNELRIVSLGTNQTVAAGLGECDAEFCPRRRSSHDFIEIFSRLYEVALP